MDNLYLQEQVARMRREDALARADHNRLMAENGLDLSSVLRRAVAERLARSRSAIAERLASLRRAVAARPAVAPVALSLVASVKQQPHEDRAA